MFDRIRKVFQRGTTQGDGGPGSSLSPNGPVSEWAASRGLSFSMGPLGHTASMHGKVGGHAWRMELGKPTRDYIHGEELRARAELGVFDDVGALIISRPLKDALERRAYSMITDTLQTTADPRLPEEMRWLAMYDEIGWEGVPQAFWRRYAVLSDRREHALAWVDNALVELLLGAPTPPPGVQQPFMLVLMRGKCYLRMQYQPAVTSTLDHASTVFIAACESALGAFGTRR
ncbi:hypothetical protein [Ramlibacter alkalitolerans]|uniref:Uncharacterized protein n=1 Tax=Ramlibacter alkalitolerans TaxID=2039631 RepID=A0ABS1JKM7_9BURK|nr:hypothetical protein [Ramlibacter alkalitolerans]MBL0424774.1 hypothetical protein [Ramlibacter alkalitolerans]